MQLYNNLKDVFPEGKWEIWYAKNSDDNVWFSWEFNELKNKLPKKYKDLSKTHVYLGSVNMNDPEEIFVKMQGEYWSPNGEARAFISSLGVHTSMSVGDAVYNKESKVLYVIKNRGFKKLQL